MDPHDAAEWDQPAIAGRQNWVQSEVFEAKPQLRICHVVETAAVPGVQPRRRAIGGQVTSFLETPKSCFVPRTEQRVARGELILRA